MMSTLLRYLNKPEYLFQPRSIVRTLRSRPARLQAARVPLPWGLSMEVDPRETIGRSLSKHGLFEIGVVEAMFRLIDEDELVLDIGANIGFMSAAAAASRAGVQVLALEPHPELFQRLSQNVQRWTDERADLRGRIRALQLAVSDHAGRATLHIPSAFEGNQGIASLEPAATAEGFNVVEVECTTIDQLLAHEGRPVGLLKIDVEGHELTAFEGARSALAGRKIRDIVFEDHEGMNSAVCRALSDWGYSLYFLGKLPWGPLLCNASQAAWAASVSFDSPNFLATLMPARAEARMAPLGYRCLARPSSGYGGLQSARRRSSFLM